jgi:EpsI family protein
MRDDQPRSIPVAALIAALLLSGAVGWWLHLRPHAEFDPESIEGLTFDLGGWEGRDIPISEGVEQMLRADSHVQRVYVNEAGETLWLYVGYYGTSRGGRPEHTPWVCYPSAGWRIESSSEIALAEGANSGEGSLANEILVERDGTQRLVHFWYATHRRIGIASEMALTIDHLAGRLSVAGRADGALVRISTPIADLGIERARKRLRRFTDSLIPEIRHRWPGSKAQTALNSRS